MKLLALYWSFMIIGYLLSTKLSKTSLDFSWVQKAMMCTIYVLCLLMGLRMGSNQQIIDNLGIIGVKSLIVTVFCIAGSMVFIFLTRKIFRMDRYGNVRGKAEETVAIATEEGGESNLKSTLIILSVVVVGMASGYFILLKSMSEYLGKFDAFSNTALVVLLTILLFFVGFDLASQGGLFENFRKVGLKALAFPVAAILGTIVVGTASCLAMGLTVKEGVAISIGFGWYTYAPVVISAAGQQYMIASAISFMYNVIRETSGIILIPVLAKKFGYIEATGVPGVAAMDVCMPIISRSCRPDTVVYSFMTGFAMCLATSIGVPLVMGL